MAFFSRGADLPSGDPPMPEHLAGAHAGDVFAEHATGVQSSAMMSQMEAKTAAVVEEMLTAMATAFMQTMAQSASGRGRLANLAQTIKTGTSSAAMSALSDTLGWHGMAPTTASPEPSANQPAATPPGVARPAGGRINVTSVRGSGEAHPDEAPVVAAPEAPTAYHPYQNFREGLDRGEKLTMGSAAKMAAAPFAKRLSEGNPNWAWETDEDGGWIRRDKNTGEMLEQVAVDDPNFAAKSASIARRAAVRSTAVGVLSGEGVAGAMGATVAKYAGPIGLAIGAAKTGANFLEGQEAKAQEFRQIYGEQTSGPFAIGNRLDAFKSSIGGFGTIGMEEARNQYMAASNMGLTGGRREQATNFMGDMMRRFGMGTEDSASLVDQAAVKGTVPLSELADAITEVSRAAVDAGKSSKEAIKDFVDAQALISETIVGGSASVAVAGDLSGIADSLPKQLSSALGGAKGLAGTLNQSTVMGMAAMNGQNPAEALWALSNPETAQAQASATLKQVGDYVLQITAGALRMSTADLRAAIMEKTGGDWVSEEQMFAIFEEVAGGAQNAAVAYRMVIPSVLRTVGQQVDQTAVLMYLFAAAMGEFDTEKDEKSTGTFGQLAELVKRREAAGGTDTKVTGYTRMSKPTSGGSYTGAKSPDQQAWESQKNEILTDLGITGTTGVYGSGTRILPGDEDAFNAYVEQVAASGSGDTTVQSLLSAKNSKKILEAAGENDLSDVRYRIKDPKTGKAVDKSLEEIIAGGESSIKQLSSGSILQEGGLPQSISVVLELKGAAADVLREQQGPSDEQRRGVAPSGTREGSYPRYNGG